MLGIEYWFNGVKDTLTPLNHASLAPQRLKKVLE